MPFRKGACFLTQNQTNRTQNLEKTFIKTRACNNTFAKIATTTEKQLWGGASLKTVVLENITARK